MGEQELRSWYESFKNHMWEEYGVQLDNPIHLGRLQAVEILQRNPQDPGEMEIGGATHVYMGPPEPKFGKEEPDIVPFNATEQQKKAHEDWQKEYHEWLPQQIRPDESLEKMQQLYDLAHEGRLMLSPLAGAYPDQICTDDTGRIYANKLSSKPLEVEELPQVETLVPPQPRPDMPTVPERLGPEEEPGFFTKLAYWLTFGLVNNDYAKWRQDQRNHDAYITALEDYNNFDVDAYNAAKSEYDSRMAQQAEPMAIRNVGMQKQVANAWLKGPKGADPTKLVLSRKNEASCWSNLDRDTAIGQIRSDYFGTRGTLNLREENQEYIDGLLGPKFRIPNKTPFINQGEEALAPLRSDDYVIPTGQNGQPLFEDREAAMICYAALADAELMNSVQPLNGLSPEENRYRVYIHPAQDMLIRGRESVPFHNAIPKVRALGAKAMQEYAAGNKDLLAKILGESIRVQNRLVAHDDLKGWPIRSSALTGELLKLVEKDPDLLAKSGLTEADLVEARGNVRFSEIEQKALEAKNMLFRATMNGKELSYEEKLNCLTDIFAANVLQNDLSNRTKEREKNPEYQKTVEEMQLQQAQLMVQIKAKGATGIGGERIMRKDLTAEQIGLLEQYEVLMHRMETYTAYSQGNYQPFREMLGRGENPLEALKESNLLKEMANQSTKDLAARMKSESTVTADCAKVTADIEPSLQERINKAQKKDDLKIEGKQTGEVSMGSQNKADPVISGTGMNGPGMGGA